MQLIFRKYRISDVLQRQVRAKLLYFDLSIIKGQLH